MALLHDLENHVAAELDSGEDQLFEIFLTFITQVLYIILIEI